jgi:hypothetical protein
MGRLFNKNDNIYIVIKMSSIITARSRFEKIINKTDLVFPIWGRPKEYYDRAIELLEHVADDHSVPITVITNRTPEIGVAHTESSIEKHHEKNFQWLVDQHDYVLKHGVTFVGLPKPVRDVAEYGKYAGLVLSNSLQSHRMNGSQVVLFQEEGVPLHDEHTAQLHHEQNQVEVFSDLEKSVRKVVQIASGIRRLKDSVSSSTDHSMLD